VPQAPQLVKIQMLDFSRQRAIIAQAKIITKESEIEVPNQ